MCQISYFLQENRAKLGLTQLALVEELSCRYVEFKELTIATYGRWERGVKIPSAKKIILLGKYFNVEMMSFVKSIDIKLSTSRIKAFDFWLDKYHQIGRWNLLFGYNLVSVGEKKIIKFDSQKGGCIDEVYNKEMVKKIAKHGAKVLGIAEDDCFDAYDRKKWAKCGALFHFIYLNMKSNEVETHSSMSLIELSQLDEFINLYQKSKLNRHNVSPPDLTKECFLFIHVNFPYCKEWNEYILDEIILFVLTHQKVKKVVINSWLIDNVTEMNNLFNGRILASKENALYPENPLVVLFGFSVADFISNHGVVNRIKKSILCNCINQE